MFQVGEAYSYDNEVEEHKELSWAEVIREAVQAFGAAIRTSSGDLVRAAESFAAESARLLDEATGRAGVSAEKSSEMAQTAEEAAKRAVDAKESVSGLVEEAGIRVRLEAEQAAAEVSQEVARIHDSGERLRLELQSHVDRMATRIQEAAAGSDDALRAAQAASQASLDAVQRIETSVNAVEEAVANARRAAEEANAAAQRSASAAEEARSAVANAELAAESSRRSATLAEQAGAHSSVLGSEADVLLERLESDYEVLTRLVQELHGRIAGLNAAGEAVAPAPAEAEERAVSETGALEEVTAIFEGSAHRAVEESTEAVAQPKTERESSYWPHINGPETNWEMPAPAAELTAEPAEEAATSYWPHVNGPETNWEMPAPTAEVTAEPTEEAVTSYWPHINGPETNWEMPVPAANAIVGRFESAGAPTGGEATDESLAESVHQEEPRVMVAGRIQVRLSPVPDFDSLLNLDGALGRINGVENVTLVDYAQDQVTFRVELGSSRPAAEFAEQLAGAANARIQLAEASESDLAILIS